MSLRSVVDVDDDEISPAFAKAVGGRLRDIRRQQRLSLHAVEAASHREFKASVLGAYERGERVISVLRLGRLARLYNVPVDQLLPASPDAPTEEPGGLPAGDLPPVIIDLARLEEVEAPERDVLRRYVGMIQIQRGDFNGRIITIRSEDVRALARVFGRDEASMRQRFAELGVLR